MREKLAKLAHDQWSGWMEYMFEECEETEGGQLIIPKWAVDRWDRQLTTDYEDLSTKEKDSDRAEADKVLACFEHLQAEIDELKIDLLTAIGPLAREERNELRKKYYTYNGVLTKVEKG